MRRRIKEAAESAKAAEPPVEEPQAAPDVPLVASAPGQASKTPLPYSGPLPELGIGFQPVVERLLAEVNPPEDFDRLEKSLSLREALTPGVLQAALNTAEDNARLAHQLYVAAKVAFARFEVDSDVALGAVRSVATAALQAEKDKGQRNKSITDADVRDRAAIMFPDEWREAMMNKAEAEATVEHLRRLADLWQQRCYSLGSMLNAGKK